MHYKENQSIDELAEHVCQCLKCLFDTLSVYLMC
uniref:Uncharacterized protein n=1 Tax=Anguilla anguilla TaxID=7936 RepID=A0A0E9XZZ1_ANGAN